MTYSKYNIVQCIILWYSTVSYPTYRIEWYLNVSYRIVLYNIAYHRLASYIIVYY